MALVATASRTGSFDVGSNLETSALAKVQAACNFVNAEVSRLRHQTIAIAVIAGIGAILLWIFTGAGNPRVPLVLASGIAVFFFVRARTELASSYRSIAAKRIVAGLGKELTYRPGSSLTRQHFIALDLFAERCGRWTSSDEIGGRVRGVKYSLHRARAGGGDRKAPFFDGVVIKVDFSDAFPAHTVIVPDHNGQLLGGHASNGAAGSRRKKDLVMLKNPEFERVFSVYSSDYYETRKLLTPEFMQIVLAAQANLDTELRLCFLQKSLYATVAVGAPRFKPTLFADPLTPQAAVGTLVPLVSLAQRLAQLRA